jgi:hypothetical protein
MEQSSLDRLLAMAQALLPELILQVEILELLEELREAQPGMQVGAKFL